MEIGSKIYVAGGSKVIGSGILRVLEKQGQYRLIGTGTKEPDWTDKIALEQFFEKEQPDYVFIAGGKSGGIELNRKKPASLMLDNLLMACNILPLAYENKVKKLLYIASSCCYPKQSPQPMEEKYLFSGKLEPTNEGYALSKLAGMTLCKTYQIEHGVDFISVIPSNYFGPGDDFSFANSHVISALISKFHSAKINNESVVKIWGTGRPTREFIFVDDLADACVMLMKNYSGKNPINIGVGGNVSIADLSKIICKIVGFKGTIEFDHSKPDGMMHKELDSSRLLKMGWTPSVSLEKGLSITYQWFQDNYRI